MKSAIVMAKDLFVGAVINSNRYSINIIKKVEQTKENMVLVTFFDAYILGADNNCLYFPDDEVFVICSSADIPYPLKINENLLEWQKRGLSYTASGYGRKIPTTKVIIWTDGKIRRIYCDIFGNIGTCYCLIKGVKVSIELFNMAGGV